MWRIGFLIDLLQTVVGCYGGFLFLWWWFVLGKASSVYAMVTIIFFGFAVQNAIGLYHRHCLFFAPETCVDHMTGAVWNLKDLLTFIGVVMLVGAMTLRAARTIRDIRAQKNMGRRETDE